MKERKYVTVDAIADVTGLTYDKVLHDALDRWLRTEETPDGKYKIIYDMQCVKYIKHKGDKEAGKLWQWKKAKRRGSLVKQVNKIMLHKIRDGDRWIIQCWSPDNEIIHEVWDNNQITAIEKATRYALDNISYVTKAYYSKVGKAQLVCFTTEEMQYLLAALPDSDSNRFIRSKIAKSLFKSIKKLGE
jgi:hypothetical protein